MTQRWTTEAQKRLLKTDAAARGTFGVSREIGGICTIEIAATVTRRMAKLVKIANTIRNRMESAPTAPPMPQPPPGHFKALIYSHLAIVPRLPHPFWTLKYIGQDSIGEGADPPLEGKRPGHPGHPGHVETGGTY